MTRRFQFSLGRLLSVTLLIAVAAIVARNGDFDPRALLVAASLAAAAFGAMIGRGMELAVALFMLVLFLGCLSTVMMPVLY